MECWNVDVPADIMRNILLRLSVKILSRFKCVCKEWYTMIESKSFVNEHFVCESNHEHLLVFKPDRHRLIYFDEECSSDYLPMLGTVHDVMGPVNGVFCVVSKNGGIGLLNPALKQFKPLPFLSLRHHTFLGFGFDPLSGYYKVVSINPHDTPPIVHVYNSGNDSWKLLQDVDSLFSSLLTLQSKSSMYLNGVYYWVMRYCNLDFDLLAFDMSSDKFRIIRLPDSLMRRDDRHGIRAYIAVYGGDSIVILSFIVTDTLIDMWVLGNDGVWTKRLTFGPFRELTDPHPLGFWKNNELMIETQTTALTMYNIRTRELGRVEAREKMIRSTSSSRNSVYTYKESLISLKGEGERDNCKLWDISSAFVTDFFKG